MAMYPSNKKNKQSVLRSAVLAVAATVGCTSGVDRAVTPGEALKLKMFGKIEYRIQKMFGKKLKNTGSTYMDKDTSSLVKIFYDTDDEADKQKFIKEISTFNDPVTLSFNLELDADRRVVYGRLKEISARPYVGTLGNCRQVLSSYIHSYDKQFVRAYHCSPTGVDDLHERDFILRNADGTRVRNLFTTEIKIKNTYVKDIDFNQDGNGKTVKHSERHALRTYERSELIQYLEEQERIFVKRETELKKDVDGLTDDLTEFVRDETSTLELKDDKKMLVNYIKDNYYLDVTAVLPGGSTAYLLLSCRDIIKKAKEIYQDKNAPVINLPDEDLPISRDLLSSLKAQNGLRHRALRSVMRIF